MLRLALSVLLVAAASGCSCGDSHVPDDPDAGSLDADPGRREAAVPLLDADPGDDADVPPAGAGTGEPCRRNEDCEAAAVAGTPTCFPGAFGWPGGYCTNEGCNPSLDDCPGDGICELGMDGGSTCLDPCDPAAPDCRAGYNCFDASGFFGGPTRHYCLPLCMADGDCEMGERCDTMGMDPTFQCYREGVALGDPCTDRSDCGAAQFCLSEDPWGFPAGYCSASCDPSMPGQCGGEVCLMTDGPTEGFCLDGCSDPSECRTGYDCNDQLAFVGMLPADVCIPACTGDADCTVAGWGCESIIGFCQATLDPAAFGGPCTDDADCLGGGCLDEMDDGAPRGYCIDECDPAAAIPGDCPPTGTCIDLGPMLGGIGICLTSCDPMMPTCRPGYVCPSFGIVTDVCIADCDSSSQCDSMCCQTGGGPFATGECVDPSGTPPPTCLP